MEKRKKMLAIVTSPFKSVKGSSLRILSMLETLSQEYDIDVITFPHGEEPNIPNLRVLRTPRWFKPKLQVSKPTLGKYILDGFVLIKAFFRVLFHRYDVIHCEDFEAAVAGLFLSFFFRKTKYVYDLHNRIADNFSIKGKSGFMVKLFNFFEKRIVKRFNLLILNWKIYESAPVFNKINKFLVYDMISPKISETEIPQGEYYAYAGNFERYQGVEEFLTTFAKSATTKKLVLMGEPTESIRSTIVENKLEERVILTGKIEPDKCNFILKNSIATIIPRTFGIQPGMKIIVYLMLGKPIIGTNIPANTEFAENMKNSLLYSNEKELLDILSTIDKNPAILTQLENGIKETQAMINKIWDKERVLNLYNGYLFGEQK